MAPRWLPYAQILVGVLLLTTPAVWQPGADSATVTYEAQSVEYADDYLRVGALTAPIRGLDCYLHDSRYCALERYVARNGPVAVDRPVAVVGRAEFVAADGFYRTVRNESADGVTLALEPVASETVLRELADPADELSDSARRAVETGEPVTAETSVERLSHQSPSSRFVAADGSYYLLRETYDARDGPDPIFETPVKVALFAVGLVLVLRGQANRTVLAPPEI